MIFDVENRGGTVALILTAESTEDWRQCDKIHEQLCEAGEEADDSGHDEVDYFLNTRERQLVIHTGNTAYFGDDNEPI